MTIIERAPAWLTRSFSVGSAPLPRNDVLRSAVTVPMVLGVAYAIGGAAADVYGKGNTL